MKKVITLLLVCTLVLVKDVYASGFHLKSIGEVQTNGIQGGKWWYSSLQPTFRGEALPGEAVNVTIDGVTLQVNADSAGEWIFTPVSALSAGEHQVNLENNGANVTFTLVLGAEKVDWDSVGQGGGETLPTVGTYWPTMLLLGIGIGLTSWGGKMWSVIKNS